MATSPNKKKILNDPIYGFVSIPDELHFDIIEHPYFEDEDLRGFSYYCT